MTPLVDALLKPMYKLREYIIVWVFIPFLLQSIAIVFYFSTRLHEDVPLEYGALNYTCESFILLTTCYFVYHEILQMISMHEKCGFRLRYLF